MIPLSNKSLLYKKCERQLFISCAPLLTGLQMAHFMMIDSKNMQFIHSLFRDTAVLEKELNCIGDRHAILLYRKNELLFYLNQPSVKGLLKTYGYQAFDIQALLIQLEKRYRVFCETKSAFPHELGIFLGYPLEDVVGYVRDKGTNAICAGYWKVYDKEKEKIALFHEFDVAKKMVEELMEQGVRPDLLISCNYFN